MATLPYNRIQFGQQTKKEVSHCFHAIYSFSHKSYQLIACICDLFFSLQVAASADKDALGATSDLEVTLRSSLCRPPSTQSGDGPLDLTVGDMRLVPDSAGLCGGQLLLAGSQPRQLLRGVHHAFLPGAGYHPEHRQQLLLPGSVCCLPERDRGHQQELGEGVGAADWACGKQRVSDL